VAERRRADLGALLVIVRALSRIAAASGPALGLGDAGPERGMEESLAARPAWQALVALAAGRYPERVRVAAREALAGLLGGTRRY